MVAIGTTVYEEALDVIGLNPMVQKSRVPQTCKVWNERRGEVRGAVREHPRTAVKIADADAVRSVLKLMSSKNLPFGQACSRVGVSQPAFWRRALNDPELKRELAALCISKPWDRADVASVNGNASALSVFAKIGEKMAASLSPQDWGGKVQVDSRQLVVVTNLDFSDLENQSGIMSFDQAQAVGICGPRARPEPGNLPEKST